MTKKTLISALAGFSLALPASAVTVDIDSFGASLNGWRKNRTAYYTINSNPYLTYKPTITPNAAGGIFISTRVEHKPRFGKTTTCYIELNYSGEGTLLSAQIKVMAGELLMDTGAIAQPPLAAAPAEGEAPPVNPEPWLNPTTRMVNQLFTALDAEFTKTAKLAQGEKKDVFSRVFGKGTQRADLSAALRHNVNLLLGYTR